MPALLDDPKQWPAWLRPSIARARIGRIGWRHLIAYCFQLSLIDPVKLRAQVEDGDRNQLGRLGLAALPKRVPAFLKLCQDGKQLFVRMTHRRLFHFLGWPS